jgi:hypothetical protein
MKRWKLELEVSHYLYRSLEAALPVIHSSIDYNPLHFLHLSYDGCHSDNVQQGEDDPKKKGWEP